MDTKFNVGDIVFSRAGRDSGRYYIVMSLEDNYAYICDGDMHKGDKPKKKKLKHLTHSGKSSEYIKAKISVGIKVTNAELRRAISEFEVESSENKA